MLERGKQSNRYLESLRKEKFLNEMSKLDIIVETKPVKQVAFNLNKFLMNQQEFLEKRNISLERSREVLNASRTQE